jgi:D-sedoheptulose 7-phosphate isomerase|tara:strand:- start:1146 stop:1733 length:588 start_codon:yes stop_codon:yes gene_type:complete
MTIEKIKSEIEASIAVKKLLFNDALLITKILDLSNKCITSLKNDGKIIFCGNGGSFADAQHISAEFTSRFLFDRPGLASIALGTNSSSMTAIGNDYGYRNVFSREIESIGNPNDILIAITTSGNSLNIIEALKAAKKKKIYSVVFTGKGKGKLPNGLDLINVPSSITARIQESHILIGHIICGIVEKSIYGSEQN